MPALSVVIPSWNGCSLLLDCLPRVIEAVRALDQPAEVVVVDDGSSDATADQIPRRHPTVRLLSLQEHQGFQAACNHGVHKSHGEVVVLLNNDALPAPDAFGPLLDPFRDPELFALRMGVKSSPEDPTDLEQLGFGARFRRGVVSTPTIDLEDPLPPGREAFYADGGASAFHRRKFMELGGLDEQMAPAYQEDVDLGLRAWMRGWRIQYEPRSVVVHPRGATTSRFFDATAIQRLSARNKILVVWKNIHSPAWLLNHLGWLTARAVLSWARRDRIWWPAFVGARRRWEAAMRARRGLRLQRRRSDRDVFNRFRKIGP